MQSQSCSFASSAQQSAGQKHALHPEYPNVFQALARQAQRLVKGLLMVMVVAFAMSTAHAQDSLPFEVSNPKSKKWPAEQATRIYSFVCDLVARAVRPEKPPRLHPKFRLVLGTKDDEYIGNGPANEIHLKSWNAEKFAQGVVVVAVKDMMQTDDVVRLAHRSVSLADSTIEVGELQNH